jgi:hypothetical protein
MPAKSPSNDWLGLLNQVLWDDPAKLAEAQAKMQGHQGEFDRATDTVRKYEIRAEECRTLADCASTEIAKQSFVGLADTYRHLALAAERIRRRP